VGGGHEAARSALAWTFFSPPTRPLSMAASSSAQPTTNPQVYFFVDFYFGYSSWVVCLICWLFWVYFSPVPFVWLLRKWKETRRFKSIKWKETRKWFSCVNEN
jgi:hypothetical protein